MSNDYSYENIEEHLSNIASTVKELLFGDKEVSTEFVICEEIYIKPHVRVHPCFVPRHGKVYCTLQESVTSLERLSISISQFCRRSFATSLLEGLAYSYEHENELRGSMIRLVYAVDNRLYESVLDLTDDNLDERIYADYYNKALDLVKSHEAALLEICMSDEFNSLTNNDQRFNYLSAKCEWYGIYFCKDFGRHSRGVISDECVSDLIHNKLYEFFGVRSWVRPKDNTIKEC